MATIPFRVGQRVRVNRDPDAGLGPWPSEPTGHLARCPEGLEYRTISTPTGEQRMWLVIFDEPQHDADGDGPYDQCPVLEGLLTALE